MREDMAKIIVTRPRLLDSMVRKGRTISEEHQPKSIGLRRHARERGGYKMLNETLAPLRRYLDRQVGRPWDRVYSEIAERLRPSSTVQQHVREHVGDFVNLHRAPDRRCGRSLAAPWWQPLYVDAAGFLRRTAELDRKARRRAASAPKLAPPPTTIRLSGACELRKLAGLWHEVRLAPLPNPEYRAVARPSKLPSGEVVEVIVRQLITPTVFDIVTGEAVACGPEIDNAEGRKRYAASRPVRAYAVAKRQLARRELRCHGLVNDLA